MTWVAAVSTGAGLGLITFGGLWLTVRWRSGRPPQPSIFLLSSLVRLFVVGLVFYGLSREGPGVALAALGGMLGARWLLVRPLGGTGHGR